MLYTGADLIRTSGVQAERLERLKIVPNEIEVQPAEKPAEAKSSLDEETQSALHRFARFINKEHSKKNPAKKQLPKTPDEHPYKKSLAVLNRHMDSGLTIDIYV